ncbi:MAG: DAK2 domain-containing protein [Clostridium sp.]|uniref:DAK2 domain-containing protein n=1 Tax=Clostridium sp. TaxID=1506 RepID=UPI003F3865F3
MEFKNINGSDFYNMVVNASNKLAENSDFVNALNVFPVPDGDTGTNMSMTFKAAVKEIENIESDSIGVVSKKLAKGALMGARGNSGVILSQILRGISKGLDGHEEVSSKEFAIALKEGSNSAYKAVMRPTEGTILSVIRATAEAGEKSNAKDVTSLLEEVTVAAKVMLDKTPDMLPALKKAKVVDSGGMGLYIILQGMLEALKDGIIAEIKDIKIGEGGGDVTGAKATADADIKFGYCTEFIILGDAKKATEFQNEIEPLGDSMIVVGYDDVIKVHIHTNDPGVVLAKAVQLGELSKIKIDNMREEHRELLANEIRENKEAVEIKEAKKYGFITVAMGRGITNIFKDLGVDHVIEGGQTMNPSTQDILECVEKLNAENIFILPNNKNIIMAANQAKEISDKNIIVIPTTTIPQGITCVSMFNRDADVSENEEELKELMEAVKTGSVTYAVRDTEIDGINIEEGDMLGLVENKIKEVGKDKFDVAEKVLENMVDDDSELITVFYGEDIKEEEANNFVGRLEEKYEDCDIQLYKGDQPLYYFLMSVE